MPKIKEIKKDKELEEAKSKVLADLLGKPIKEPKKDWSNRRLTNAQRVALECLEKGQAFEVVTQTVQFGDDSVDPTTKQVRPYEKQKGLIVTIEVDPEEKGWIEHLMKTLYTVPLKKSEVELFQRHIKRLNATGALRDHYEFYGLSLKELGEKEEEYREQGLTREADRIRQVIERSK